MAHFAKIGLNSKVIAVNVVLDADTKDTNGVELEEIGREFLERIHGWPIWVKTSYNTKEGQHYKNDGITLSDDQSKAFRKNFAGVGMIWDEDKNMFYAKKPYDSWTLNLTTGKWDSPVSYPNTETDGKKDSYEWNEGTTSWDKVDGQIV